jgi:hypothetical protein
MEMIVIVPLLLLAGIVFAAIAIIAPEQVTPRHKAVEHPQTQLDDFNPLAHQGEAGYIPGLSHGVVDE